MATQAMPPSDYVVQSFARNSDGMTIQMARGALKLVVINDRVVRVIYSPTGEIPTSASLVITATPQKINWATEDSKESVGLSTKLVTVKVDKGTGAVAFYDKKTGKLILHEAAGGREAVPAEISGEKVFGISQAFESPSDEGIYGLGQHPEGVINWRGRPIRLHQINTSVAMPIIISSKGYGIYWDNYSLTYFNKPKDEIKLDSGKGTFTPSKTGDYVIFAETSNSDGITLWVNDEKVIDYRNIWTPESSQGKIHLEAGKQYNIRAEGRYHAVFAQMIGDTNRFSSEVADAIDYYFIYGPEPDAVISAFRNLSGPAPMLPKWAMGFWQCRERYSSQDEIVNAANEFRKRGIPMDCIVQDWQYWGIGGDVWNGLIWDRSHYPDPAKLTADLHKINVKLSVSIWSNFGNNTEVCKQMSEKKLLVPGTNWFDAYNPKAREFYWEKVKSGLYDYGVDCWWNDASEPEEDAFSGKTVALGPASRYRNTYPLFVTKAVYEGQRKTTSDRRVCILTRSAFPGQQRNSAITWSGDIAGSWDSLRRQIPTGLNFCMTGIPYWTTDIGGFFRPGDQYASKDYRELLTRWFQWGAFCPIFRVHGFQSDTVIWNYGKETEQNLRKVIELRYRLMPYIYSLAGEVTNSNYTMMRGLVMDFRSDAKVLDITDQFMFGPAILVNPVITPGAASREVYLPKGGDWYDFWTGAVCKGGQTVKSDAPIDHIPLYVKAGSIIPTGPDVQYANEPTNKPIQLRIYPGANGKFTLYEDEGDGYGYEKNASSQIAIKWDDKKKTLTIGKRQGSYPGMAAERKFIVVLVKPGQGVGDGYNAEAGKVVGYNGTAVSIEL